MENNFDRRERTLYVWMMHPSVNDEELYEMFSKAGPIEKVIFKENPDGTPQHALVIFRNVNSVTYAMRHLQNTIICGQPISIRPLRESIHHLHIPSMGGIPLQRPLNSDYSRGARQNHAFVSNNSDKELNYRSSPKTAFVWDKPQRQFQFNEDRIRTSLNRNSEKKLDAYLENFLRFGFEHLNIYNSPMAEFSDSNSEWWAPQSTTSSVPLSPSSTHSSVSSPSPLNWSDSLPQVNSSRF